jgi:HAMP domain-containing protein/signal transduction histidine kinase/CheY-like chemotaxis protein
MSTETASSSSALADARSLLAALRSLKKGDFSVRLPLDQTGIAGEVAETFNDVVDLLQGATTEIERVSVAVGKEGKTNSRAVLAGAVGGWANRIEAINSLIADLTRPTVEVSRVIGAVAAGDLSQHVKLEFDGLRLEGEFLRLGRTVNGMVDQLRSFASEVTRVVREIGSEGKLGGQAHVKGVAGTWKDLTDGVNSMAGNLTSQMRSTAEVTTAIANGDLSKKITIEVQGEILQLKNSINGTVDRLNAVASEVTRVAREVGVDGKLGGQAVVKDVAGTWKDLTDSVNMMAGNLTGQVRNIAEVATAIANGDLSKKVTADVKGEVLDLKDTVNTMVDQLQSFASEVTRVAREVGTDGKLGGQAEVKGVAGTWKDLTDNVNQMAGNLTNQVRNIAEVTTAVANGDLSKKITVDVKGEILDLKNTINTMVDQLQSFASEVTRVAREVGTDGKLGGQAEVKGVAGTWKDLTDNVNVLAGNLTSQVRNIAEVTTAVANGDLSKKISVEAKGEILDLKNTINTMVDQLQSFASEVTRVAREVGTDGKLGGQAAVSGVAGTWKDLTDNVNAMAGNLTVQLRDVSKVATAIAGGDLTQKITVDVKGEILQIKDTINTMVDQLNSFASEVTRVAREVGTDGKLGGQAEVRGTAGTWKDLTDNVNVMAANLTSQVRNIAEVTIGVASGDLSKKITVDVRGEILQLKEAINTMVDQLRSFASEVTRVAREVGTDGKLGGQAVVPGVAGVWKDLTDNVNGMAANLTAQVRNIAQVTTAVAKGDLTQKITVDVKGEILELKSTINTMVDQLNAFAAEVTRVAREVGTEGKLGGQAEVKGVGGTWKDLTDNVNVMAANLTDQVRSIAKVVTATAKGNLKEKLTLPAKGEIAALADTINAMNDRLATFADQVTTVAREVGVEGKLGGQANVPGAAGTWKDLTDNVNELAANLTSQVRAIAEVATAVTKGDMTRSINVEARGEVDELKNNLNEMIGTLRDTTQRNTEQDWLKTNLAEFTRTLQGQRDLMAVAKLILSKLAPLVQAQHGVFYVAELEGNTPVMKLLSSYAYRERKGLSNRFQLGEGLVGQCALEKERILMTEVPGEYIHINSGLGDAVPCNIVVLPVVFEGQVRAVIELASFTRLTDIHLNFLDQLTEGIGIVLNTIQAGMRTEELLKQSQSLAEELQTQQEELKEKNTRLEQQATSLRQSEELLKKQQEQLQQSNEELEEKARLLAGQKTEVERKNHQIEEARKALQDKAEQLTLSSKYKSEFLANMSHELRTPLNSLLILSNLLTDNRDGNLSPQQLEYVRTIHSSGSDLLSLINDILDMSKVESGTVALENSEVSLQELGDYVNRTFQQVAENKHLTFGVAIDPQLPATIWTDGKRLQQVLKNLLSNAFKFTEQGAVDLRIVPAAGGWNAEHEQLNSARRVMAFSVTDTGIGIANDKLKIIFEPFQQADTGTARKYGGTGLGLSISREIARLLGGDLRVESKIGQGSTFTLYLPHNDAPTGAVEGLSKPTAKSATQPAVLTQPADGTVRQAVVLAPSPEINDDRLSITGHDRVLLIIEDDADFARVLLAIARERGFKGIVALSGETGFSLARHYKPDAITLDIKLPDISGWQILDRLKRERDLAQIPVHVVSALDEEQQGVKLGAFAYLKKPVDKEALEQAFTTIEGRLEHRVRRLLVVDDNELECGQIISELAGADLQATAVHTGTEALQALKTQKFDGLVLDLILPDMSGLDLLDQIEKQLGLLHLPVAVYTSKTLSTEEEAQLKRRSEAVIVKDSRSPERLAAETSLFLHRVEASLPDSKQRAVRQIHARDPSLSHKKVLVVDDDLRNIFALTAVLEREQMQVFYAENGKDAIASLERIPLVNVVLMDIMMPEMDGYETMRRIRGMDQFKSLPIIALTAKAMKGDREKCIEAGASDYIAKPVDPEQLLSLLRVWLYRQQQNSPEPGATGAVPETATLQESGTP